MEYASDKSADFEPSPEPVRSFTEALSRDPIAIVRSLIRGVSLYYFAFLVI